MAEYLIEATYTAESWATLIKNPHDRYEAMCPLIESLGGRYEHAWLAPNDAMLVGIFDLPDQETVGALNLGVQASGAVASVRVIPLIPHDQTVEVFRRAGRVGYQPPA